MLESIEFIFGAAGFVGTIFAFFRIDAKVLHAHIAASRPTKREKVMAACAALGFLSCGFGFLQISHSTGMPAYMLHWGTSEIPRSGMVTVDGSLLMSRASKYRVAAVCYIRTQTGDVLDETGLEKSSTYDIVSTPIEILIPWDTAFVNELVQGYHGTDYEVLLVPNGVTMNQFSTLRQAKAIGVILLQGAEGPP